MALLARWDAVGAGGSCEERAPAPRRRLALCLLLAATVLLCTGARGEQPPVARDYEIKAAYLVKFTQYTVWPRGTPAATNPIVIGVVGADPVFSRLEQEARAAAGPRPVEARRLRTIDEAADCQVVFVGEAESRSEAEWFAALRGKPVLTVGESEQAIERGAVMRFVIRNQTVRFEANLDAAADSHLELSARMLAVASRVHRRTGGRR